MKHILYLPSWFPSRRNPFPGDFIKRHAEAASIYNRITIFYTSIDETIDKPEVTEEKINDNLSIYIYYYPSNDGLFSSLKNGIKRFKSLRKLYNHVFAKFSPDLVHVHVAFPAGLFALYLKKRQRLAYIISEHDGIFMPGYDNYHIPGIFERMMMPVIYKQAKKIHAVSKSLANALVNRKLVKTAPVVIPNVVDTALFKYRQYERKNTFQFVHVSSLINQKNPEGMLAAMQLVKKNRNDFVLKIIGPAKERFIALVKQYSLDNEIIFLNEISYKDVANEVCRSDAMIHFTRYETFGCVIAESLCCGIPVIVSDLDVTRELVTDGVNGILVRENNIQDLADKVLYFMDGGFKVDRKQVAEESEAKFNYKKVGEMINDLYASI